MVVEQGDRLRSGRVVGVVAHQGVDPVLVDGLVTADAAGGERVEADVGDDARVVAGGVAHPVDEERLR